MQPVIAKYRAGAARYCKSEAGAAGSADVGPCGVPVTLGLCEPPSDLLEFAQSASSADKHFH